ncbi:hypothetical protein [Nitrogeniibacter aestuarii]|uniref:hypothetical protein n=1 Tax=Nitrogeniibacter aestuarii TaxID=2815343 RepID=UPI001D111F40|nr:hypothetical protein [Nitrogeniibacter aestuarii]
MIASIERRASWLDIAAAPIWKTTRPRICIHAMCVHNSTCHAISLDGRWICSTDGSLSVFETRRSAEHFLELAHVETFEEGEDAELAPGCDCHTHCISFRERQGLAPCEATCSETH